MSEPPVSEPPVTDPPPPLMGSWRNLYLLVMATLAGVVGLLWLLQKVYG